MSWEDITAPQAGVAVSHHAPLSEPGAIVGIVLCHAGAKDVVNRHWPNWMAAFRDVYMVCPNNDALPGSFTVGTSQHHGPCTVDRMKFAVAMASRFPMAAVLEYDTLVWNLESSLESGVVLASRVFKNNDPQFEAQTFAHSPWIAKGDTWWRILQAGWDMQGGWPDRWLALACQRAGVKLGNLSHSYSCDWGWSEEVIAEAVEHRKRGAQAIHGFKDEAIFNKLCPQS